MSRVSDRRVTVNGLSLHYRDWHGPHELSPAVVLLHGLSGHARTWDALAASLCSHYRVLALDQRGHGESDWDPARNYATSDLLHDFEAFVTALQLERYALLGLSMGGRVSIAHAGARPAGLQRLVLVDIGAETDPNGMASIQANAQRTDTFASISDAMERARADNPVPPLAHHEHRIVHGLMRQADGLWTYRYDRALRDPNAVREHQTAAQAWTSVASIAVPTLLVRGANSDILSPAVAERMCTAIAQCEFVEIAGAGHSVPLDKPVEFGQAVTQFLCKPL